MPKVRLDQLLVVRELCESREQAQRLILAGAVLVDDRPATKPGHLVAGDVDLRLRETLPFVSRGGEKLAAALQAFNINPSAWICADIGASTGGFTDVLLQQGAARVYAVDVGYGQLHWRLRQDPRVAVMERTNVRYLAELPEAIDLATIDTSFISLRLVLPPVRRLLAGHGQIVALVKPQFEAGKDQVGKGGVVRDETVHRLVLDDLVNWAAAHDLSPQGLVASPLLGSKGNREFLLWMRPDKPPQPAGELIASVLG